MEFSDKDHSRANSATEYTRPQGAGAPPAVAESRDVRREFIELAVTQSLSKKNGLPRGSPKRRWRPALLVSKTKNLYA
jgi:hypothetical protein